MQPKPTKSSKDSFLIAFGTYSAVGFQLVLCILLGAYGGNFLDQRWNVSPWLLLLGLALGSAAGFYQLFRVLKWKNK